MDIILSKELLIELIAAYRQAVGNKDASFIFHKQEFLTAYAYYFIRHWAPQFGVQFDEPGNDNRRT